MLVLQRMTGIRRGRLLSRRGLTQLALSTILLIGDLARFKSAANRERGGDIRAYSFSFSMCIFLEFRTRLDKRRAGPFALRATFEVLAASNHHCGAVDRSRPLEQVPDAASWPTFDGRPAEGTRGFRSRNGSAGQKYGT